MWLPPPVPRVAAVEHELLGGEAGEAGFFIKGCRIVDQLVPRVGRVDVHLDDPRIGSHLDVLDARVAGRRIALDDHGKAQLAGGVLHRVDDLEEILDRAYRRQEHMKAPMARLNAERRPDDP
jgi:hypothetical protein